MLTGPLFPEITLDLLLKDAVVDILLRLFEGFKKCWAQNKFSFGGSILTLLKSRLSVSDIWAS